MRSRHKLTNEETEKRFVKQMEQDVPPRSARNSFNPLAGAECLH